MFVESVEATSLGEASLSTLALIQTNFAVMLGVLVSHQQLPHTHCCVRPALYCRKEGV